MQALLDVIGDIIASEVAVPDAGSESAVGEVMEQLRRDIPDVLPSPPASASGEQEARVAHASSSAQAACEQRRVRTSVTAERL